MLHLSARTFRCSLFRVLLAACLALSCLLLGADGLLTRADKNELTVRAPNWHAELSDRNWVSVDGGAFSLSVTQLGNERYVLFPYDAAAGTTCSPACTLGEAFKLVGLDHNRRGATRKALLPDVPTTATRARPWPRAVPREHRGVGRERSLLDRVRQDGAGRGGRRGAGAGG